MSCGVPQVSLSFSFFLLYDYITAKFLRIESQKSQLYVVCSIQSAADCPVLNKTIFMFIYMLDHFTTPLSVSILSIFLCDRYSAFILSISVNLGNFEVIK